MSEFECSNGHMPTPSTIRNNRCPCGAPIVRMDGMSGRALGKMDKEWDRICKEEFEKGEGGEEK